MGNVLLAILGLVLVSLVCGLITSIVGIPGILLSVLAGGSYGYFVLGPVIYRETGGKW